MINRLLFPWATRMRSDLVVNLATLWKVGLTGKAPGTNGSAVGLIYFLVFFYPLGIIESTLLIMISLYFAVGICGEAEIRMGKEDPGEVVLDEFVVMPICFLGVTSYMQGAILWYTLLAGFILFRIFDILKPFGIKKTQTMPGGLGVVIDDVLAAIASCFVLNLGFFILILSGVIKI